MKLEVGMYVRTTYGIGKITKGYIVYDDSGNLWMLSYMTDNPKIEVSIYTKEASWKLFGKVQKDHRIKYEPLENNLNLVENIYKQELDEIVCYVPINKDYPRCAELFDDHKFIKANYDITNILENGDILLLFDKEYEKKYKAEVIIDNENFKSIINYKQDDLLNLEYELITNEHIELLEILTKERFEQMSYKIGD